MNSLPYGFAAPPVPPAAAAVGWTPGRWHNLRTDEQARALDDARKRVVGLRSERRIKTLGAEPATPRLADVAGRGLWTSDFRNTAGKDPPVGWWSRVLRTGEGPWDIELLFGNGGSLFRALQRLLQVGLPDTWMGWDNARQTRPPELDGFLHLDTLLGLWVYAKAELSHAGFPLTEIIRMVAAVEADGRAALVSQNTMALALYLLLYRPWPLAAGGFTATGPLGTLNYADLGLPVSPAVAAGMIQLPSDTIPWKFGEYLQDPVPFTLTSEGWTNKPFMRGSPYLLGADGAPVLRTGAHPIQPGELPPYIPQDPYLPYGPGSGFNGIPGWGGGGFSWTKVALVAAAVGAAYLAWGGGGDS